MNHDRILRFFSQYYGQKASALLALFSFAFLPLHAASLDDLTWTTTDGEITITGCDEAASGELVIPDTIGGDPVTRIGEQAFRDCTSLEVITIPDSVSNLGIGAFYQCTGLTVVAIGNGVTSIGNLAFYGCSSLEGITIPDSVTSLGDGAFLFCDSLAAITIPDSVTSIGDSAFWLCLSLASVTIGDSVTSIGEQAFRDCISLASVTMGDSVTSIGEQAFRDCASLEAITISDSVSNLGIGAFYQCTGLTVVAIGNGVTSIGEQAFDGCVSLASVTIGESVTSIGNLAFFGCSSLEGITIPDSVTSLGGGAFQDCTGLASVTIGDSVTSIGSSSFRDCTSLASVTIGDSVASIGGWAFHGCTSLTGITIPQSVTSIGEQAFRYCRSLASITIPEGVTSIEIATFRNCTSLTSITIPDSVTSIRNAAFADCTSLTSVAIGNGVTSTGSATFWGCESLASITMGDRVTSIGSSSFRDCTSLEGITIPDSVTSIGVLAFLGCTSLTSLSIPDSVTSIGDNAFQGCASLEGITIPDSVTSIGNDTFFGCTSLASVTLGDSVTSIGVRTFRDCTSLASVTIGGSVTSIGEQAFAWCDSLESITIPDSVTSIGNWAFFGCHSLASVTIGKSVASIGAGAFRYCNALESITFLGSAPTAVGVNAFGGVAAGAVAIMLGEEQASFGEVGAAWNRLTLVDGRPANDHFRNLKVIAGVSGSVFGSNVNATLESSEPTTVAGFEAGSSVWFSWEAPATGTFRFHLTADFDSQLGIFTGDAVGALTVHGESDPPDGSSELVTLAASRGANYWVRVTGDLSQSGEFLLDWGAEPANDQFGNPLVIAGASGQVSRSNKYASLQPGEPTATDGIPAGNSVWFSWEALATGTFSFHLTADFDSQLAIFTGEGVGALTVHGESDPEFGRGDSVTLMTDEGTNYWVRVTGDSSQRGTFTLDWSNAPANDKFGRPQWITGIEVEGSLSGSNVNATLQPGEPRTVGGHSANRSVWFAWEAPATGTFSLRLTAADFDSQLAIFTGEAVGALTVLDESDGDVAGGRDEVVTVAAEEGKNYWVRVSSNENWGAFTLDWSIHPVFEKVFSFTASSGKGPLGSLVQGLDGNFYGTTLGGGATDSGTIFSMTPGGVLTTLVNFTGVEGDNLGRAPEASLVQGRDGNFYGTTRYGGENDDGTVFRVTPAGVLTTLVEFTGAGGGNLGRNPEASLVQGSDGNFYGTTPAGGANNKGTVFKMTPAGVLTTLVGFTGNGGGNLGRAPKAALVEGSDGNFYGTTQSGGIGSGTVFRMTPAGVLTTLIEFTGNGSNNKGRDPQALVQGGDGNFYGTTGGGGARNKGTVFMMTPAGVLTTLVEFTGNGDADVGALPGGGLVLGSDGDFYGMTERGGTRNLGTVFKMTPEGVLTTLVQFSVNGVTDAGAFPGGGLVLGSDGDFYGMTQRGGFGIAEVGTVFKMTPEGVLTTLIDFASNRSADVGTIPRAALVLGSDGNFYGTTSYDGATDAGTVFMMTPAGVSTTLVEFTGREGAERGSRPAAALVQGIDGDFYGTAREGGARRGGTVFKMTPSGVLTTLVDFNGIVADETFGENLGWYPEAALVQGSDGNFYGTTLLGGGEDKGTIFMMTPAGVLTTLVEFSGRGLNGAADVGANPRAALVLGSDGNFYGTTSSGGVVDRGTVFRMTPAGVLTTLVEFTGVGGDNLGRAPEASLVQGSDGNFYGTTRFAGTNGHGTAFMMTPEGVLTTLVNFTGAEGPNEGTQPNSSLVQGSDGNFYGTTLYGGADDNGTVFTMTPAGVVTTFHEFGNDGSPVGPLVAGPDGDFYGALSAVGTTGGIYRLVFRGVPSAYLLPPPRPPEELTSTSAVLQSIINPRGAVVEDVRIEYGTDGATFPNTVAIPRSFTGYQGIEVGRTVSSLTLGTTYYYRFHVTSSAGETVSAVQSFSTLAEPTVAIVPVSEITPGSARLNGVVNARNSDSDVIFEYGPDGSSFPNSVAAEPAVVTGSEDIEVSAQIAGLDAGHTYYYRLVASNIGGTAVSGQGTFRTLTEPVAVLGGASALSTTRAQVDGSVDARGSDAAVDFEYWSEEETSAEAIKVPATPAAVSGEGSIEVQATLTGLAQGTTYHYRIRAVGPGGTGLSEAGTFSLSLLSGLDQTFPDPPTSATGEVTVNIAPSDMGGWRFAGERQWRVSGETVANLASGDRLVEFRPVPGYIHPPTELVGLTSSDPERVLEATYFQTLATGTGTLTVYLKPDSLAGAQWRFSGETDWRDGEVEISGLTPGTYLVESKPVADRVTPPTTSVTVEDGIPGALTLTYFHANNPTGEGAEVVSFTDVSNNEDLPLAYLGQIRSPVGSSTGFVVKRRVVATAGHVVFDDGSLSFISDLQWLFQRDSSEHEPIPQTPRGFYLAAGYADARQEPGVEPGEGTPESQDLDYAVLYFQEEAGRGGVGGFLASEAMDENEFLSSSAEKMLAGYPVDGIPESDLGKVHATPVFTDALVPAFGETWTTSAVYGVGGISGGPLFARHSNGAFYPAAIYLGGAGQAVVRAIDSDVVDLFLRAEASGNGGENNTGGGITHTSVAGNISATDPGALQVVIEPASATAMGAGWQLVPESTWRQGGTLKSGLSAGTYNLVFNPIEGFQAPEMQAVEVTGGQFTTVTFTYEEESVASPLETWRQDNFGTTSKEGDAADDADPDQDGMTNLNEYTAGTDPNSSTDFLKMSTVTKSGSTFSAGCDGKAGRVYTLQRNTGLEGEWTPLSSQGPLAADGTVSLTDDPAPADTSFYRIEVSMP